MVWTVAVFDEALRGAFIIFLVLSRVDLSLFYDEVDDY